MPEFLGGDLKYKSHHILVTYKKVLEPNVATQLNSQSLPISMKKSLQENDFTNLSKKSASFDRKGECGQNALLYGRASRITDNLSKSLQEKDLKHSTRKSSANPFHPGVPYSYRGIQDNLSRSLPENGMKLKEEYSFGQDESKNTKHYTSPILPSQRGRMKKNSRNSWQEDDNINETSLANSSTCVPNREEQNRLLPRAGTLQKTSRRNSNSPNKSSTPKSGPNTLFSDESDYQIDREYEDFESKPLPLHHSFSTVDDFKQKNSPTRLTVSASAADLRAMQVKFDPALTSGSEPNLASKQKRSLISWFKGRRGSKNAKVDRSSEQFSGELDESLVEEGSSEISLYMTLDDSVMLAYLRSTWENCSIVSF